MCVSGYMGDFVYVCVCVSVRGDGTCVYIHAHIQYLCVSQYVCAGCTVFVFVCTALAA